MMGSLLVLFIFESWWLSGLFVFVVLMLVLVFIRRRIESNRRNQVRLEVKIAERTKEIRLQKTKIEEQKRLLEEEKNKVVEQQALLQKEKDRTEQWLLNTLPSEVVIELKRNGKVKAQAFKQVSIMFTDVVGFTRISESMAPSRIVSKLDVLFQKFDEIIQANNLEKIKTIGDAYMCAGGVPVENSTNPIDACCAALQIQAFMDKLKYEAIAYHEDYW
jgi:class 3 adenylate cyclase